MDIQNKVIIVTGASEGIGIELAKQLDRLGTKLVLAARSGEKLAEIAQGMKDALAVATDMRQQEDIQNLIGQAMRKFGRIDGLVNNAGQGMYGPVEHIDLAQYEDIMNLNVFAVVRAMQAVIPIMKEQGGGAIVNISSRVSKNYFPHLAAYASTKYALNCISLTARKELEPDGIIVSVFYPKMTATNFGANAIGQSPAAARNRDAGIAGPNVDTPAEVAREIIEQLKSGEAERSM